MLITVRNQGFFFSPLIDDCFFSFLCWFETSFVTLELTRRNYSSVSIEPRTSANANTNRKTFLLYTCETWWMSKFSINKHQMFMKRYLWKMLWVRWQGRQTDEALWELTNQQFIEPQIKKKKGCGVGWDTPYGNWFPTLQVIERSPNFIHFLLSIHKPNNLGHPHFYSRLLMSNWTHLLLPVASLHFSHAKHVLCHFNSFTFQSLPTHFHNSCLNLLHLLSLVIMTYPPPPNPLISPSLLLPKLIHSLNYFSFDDFHKHLNRATFRNPKQFICWPHQGLNFHQSYQTNL